VATGALALPAVVIVVLLELVSETFEEAPERRGIASGPPISARRAGQHLVAFFELFDQRVHGADDVTRRLLALGKTPRRRGGAHDAVRDAEIRGIHARGREVEQLAVAELRKQHRHPPIEVVPHRRTRFVHGAVEHAMGEEALVEAGTDGARRRHADRLAHREDGVPALAGQQRRQGDEALRGARGRGLARGEHHQTGRNGRPLTASRKAAGSTACASPLSRSSTRAEPAGPDVP
jgi:hypothetical protein